MALVCNPSMRTGRNQGSYSCLGKHGQPYQTLLVQIQVLHPSFLMEKSPRKKNCNSFLFTHAKRQKTIKEPLVLRCQCCKCGWGRSKDLSSLGGGNTSDTGEFHTGGDCCPLSSWLRIPLACPDLSRASVLLPAVWDCNVCKREDSSINTTSQTWILVY